MGEAASKLDPVAAAYLISSLYAGLLPSDLRAELGIYYTPAPLAARLLDQATAAGVNWSSCRVLDPACGGGAFLAPVAQRMVKELSHLEAAELVNLLSTRLRGFEVDPFAAWMSQVFLEVSVMPVVRAAQRRLPQLVDVRDALRTDRRDGGYDLVIGNPPYGRVTLPTPLRQRFARSLYGHANLYGVFTDLALRLATPVGVVAYVTPTSFLAGEYFTRLRQLLAAEAPPVTIDLIAQRRGVFDGVLQEALLATYRRGSQASNACVHFLDASDEHTISVSPVGDFSLPAESGQPWIIPRTPSQAPMVRVLRRLPHRLADWGYSISTGPLVWNRHKEQLFRDSVSGSYPVIWAEAVSRDGHFSFKPTKKNHKPFFRPSPGDQWLVVRRPCVLVQRTTAKEQHRRLIAALLPLRFLRQHTAVTVENHLNMVYPTSARPIVPQQVVASFLNSTAADDAFRCISGSVAVSAYELEALPVPPPQEVAKIAALLESGADARSIDMLWSHLYSRSS